jgi:hypothetical protein
MLKNNPNQNSTENYHKGSCVEFFLSKGIPSRNTTHEHLGETSLIFVQTPKKVTDKTEKQLMTSNWEELTLDEKALRSDIERHPKMSWEDALALSEMSPL